MIASSDLTQNPCADMCLKERKSKMKSNRGQTDVGQLESVQMESVIECTGVGQLKPRRTKPETRLTGIGQLESGR